MTELEIDEEMEQEMEEQIEKETEEDMERDNQDDIEQAIEKEIQEKGLTAPRLTPDIIDSKIESTKYHILDDTTITICVITLENGFTVTGESACASSENFDQEIGEKISFENARNKIWVLEGYLLKQSLFDTPGTYDERLDLEKEELEKKITKLQEFIITDEYTELSQEHQNVLIVQNSVMESYLVIIKQRLELIGKDDD